jgi:hypothetical protein
MSSTNFSGGVSQVKLGTLTEDQLRNLANWCTTRANKLVFDRAHAEQLKRDAEWKREQEVEEAKQEGIVAKLKSILKPGMRLKMKGCKDRKGIREFIRWDVCNNLVCWQICQRMSYIGGDYRYPRREEWNSNIVTTHMPNKVQEIYVDGTGIKIGSF